MHNLNAGRLIPHSSRPRGIFSSQCFNDPSQLSITFTTKLKKHVNREGGKLVNQYLLLKTIGRSLLSSPLNI